MEKEQVDLKKLMKKLGIADKSAHSEGEGHKNGSKQINRIVNETVQFSRTKVKGTFTMNNKGRCYIYGCESVSDARKLAMISMRDINSAMKMHLKINDFRVMKIRTVVNL